MNRVLIVEDSVEAFELVRRALGTSVQLEWVKTQRDAAALMTKPQQKPFDLILLDVTLPDGDGFQFCSLLQAQEAWSSTPVIILSARNSIGDKVMGFSVGAEDFVSKPFDALELKARVEAKLRKRERSLQASDVISCNGLEIRKSTQQAYLTANGEMELLDLTPLEFKILLHLASRPQAVVSRDEMLDVIWGENVHVYSRSVDTHISKLRKKLGAKSHYIASAHGVGYRFVGESQEEEPRRPLLAVYADPAGLQYGRLA